MAGVVLHLDNVSIADSAASVGAPSEASPTPSSQAHAHDWRPPSRVKGLLVTFKDVCYTLNVKKKKKRISILKNVTGYFEPGQMTAVMGPSGSGKTTFLDVLAGRKTVGQISGKTTFGGVSPTPGLLRRATGYVEQFDTLVDTLTVHEMLLYTAQLKRPMKEGYAAKKEAVEHLIAKLGLGSCSDTRIGNPLKRGISGGQAKRVNIGIALITDPRVLFLDEPTSGLDSFTANEVMSVVKTLTKDGTTIAATIHSPSSMCYSLFDRVLVLLSGNVVYFGCPQQQAINFFTSVWRGCSPKLGDNLAEWMLELVVQADRNKEADMAATLYKDSELCRDNGYQLATLVASEKLKSATSSSFIDFDAQTLGLKSGGQPGSKEPNLATHSNSSSGSSTIAARRRSSSGSGSGCQQRRQKRGSLGSPPCGVDGKSIWASLPLGGVVSAGGSKVHICSPNITGISGDLPVAFTGSSSSSRDVADIRSGSGGGSSGWCRLLGARISSNLRDMAYNTPPWWGLKVLLQYRTLRNYRTPDYLAAHLMDKLGFALVLLSLFWGRGDDFTPANVPVQISLIFLLVAAPAWGAVAYVPSIVLDRTLFIRERQDGLYSPLVYLTFKMLDEMMLLAPASLATAAITYFGIQLQGSFLLYWLITYVTLANGIAMSYLIASLSSTMAMANAAVPLLLSCALVFCGFILRKASMPVYYLWLLKANVFHYSWGALMVNHYDQHRNANLGGMRVLTYYGLDQVDAWQYLGIACGFLTGWTFLTWLALEFCRRVAR